MIKLYSEIPPPFWHEVKNLAILAPHWKKYSKKEKEIALSKDIFLDNMVFENTPLSLEEYLDVVKEIKVAKFVLPDTINNEEDTLEKHKEFLNALNSTQLRNNAMAVIQGIPSMKIIEWIVKEELKYICVPYLPSLDRYNIIKDIIRKVKLIDKNNSLPYIHLLGIEHISELFLYSHESKYVHKNMPNFLNVVSADSGILYYSTVSEKCKNILTWDKFKIDEKNWKRKLNTDYVNFFKTRINDLREKTCWEI